MSSNLIGDDFLFTIFLLRLAVMSVDSVTAPNNIMCVNGNQRMYSVQTAIRAVAKYIQWQA